MAQETVVVMRSELSAFAVSGLKPVSIFRAEIRNKTDKDSSKKSTMVLRPSPQGSSTMTQEPVANVNGVHPGRPSQIRFGSNTTGLVNTNPSNENQKSDATTIPGGTRPQQAPRQASIRKITERAKVISQLTNGDHGSSDVDYDLGSNVPDADAQDNWQMRHGWEDQYNSEEYLSLLSSVGLGRSAQ